MLNDLISIYSNWRCHVLTILSVVAFLLTICEAEDLKALFLSKAFAFALWYAVYRLYRYWDEQNKTSELRDFIDKEDC